MLHNKLYPKFNGLKQKVLFIPVSVGCGFGSSLAGGFWFIVFYGFAVIGMPFFEGLTESGGVYVQDDAHTWLGGRRPQLLAMSTSSQGSLSVLMPFSSSPPNPTK